METIEQALKRINEKKRRGYGCGRLSGYTPWITVPGGPSGGESSVFYLDKTGREHHALSKTEYQYMLTLNFSQKIQDIREQMPYLDLQKAVYIAEKAGIRYPTHYKNRDTRYTILTSDVMVTELGEDGALLEKVRTVKQSGDLENPRVIEKLELERLCWQSEGITDYKIVTPEQINPIFVQNCETALYRKLVADRFLSEALPAHERLSYKEHYLDYLLAHKDEPVFEINRRFDTLYNLPRRTSGAVFGEQVHMHRLVFDMENVLLDFNKNMRELENAG